MMCRSMCNCGHTNKCNPETGDCLTENVQIIFDWSDNSGSNIMRLPNDRIKAKHWIQVNGNGKLIMKNCTNLEKCSLTATVDDREIPTIQNQSSSDDKLANLIGKTHQHHIQIQKNNSLMMDALNSSIANLTTDIGKLSKQVFDQHVELKQSNDENLPKMAILLDTPSIITHSDDTADAADLQQVSINKLEDLISLPSHSLLETSGAILQNVLNTNEGTSYVEENRQSEEKIKNVNEQQNQPIHSGKEFLHILTVDNNSTTHTITGLVILLFYLNYSTFSTNFKIFLAFQNRKPTNGSRCTNCFGICHICGIGHIRFHLCDQEKSGGRNNAKSFQTQ